VFSSLVRDQRDCVCVYAKRGLKIPERGCGPQFSGWKLGARKGSLSKEKGTEKGDVVVILDYNLRSPHILAHTRHMS
jgi:hypothetical protein